MNNSVIPFCCERCGAVVVESTWQEQEELAKIFLDHEHWHGQWIYLCEDCADGKTGPERSYEDAEKRYPGIYPKRQRF